MQANPSIPALLVVGAGPAGMSAALWAVRLGLGVTLVESAAQPGGQLLGLASTGDWALGAGGLGPADLAARYAADLTGLAGLTRLTGRAVERLALDAEPGLVASHADGTRTRHAAVIVATGLRPRAIPAAQFSGSPARLVVGAGDGRLAGALDGARVGILGGGDNAFEVALLLATRGVTVEIMHRRVPRAMPRFRGAVAAQGIAVRALPDDYRVTGEATRITVHDGATARAYDWLVALLGYVPNTEWLRASGVPFSDAALDAAGFVLSDAAGRTPVARLYAAGDCTGRPYAGLPMAVGQGAVAAKSAALDLARWT